MCSTRNTYFCKDENYGRLAREYVIGLAGVAIVARVKQLVRSNADHRCALAATRRTNSRNSRLLVGRLPYFFLS